MSNAPLFDRDTTSGDRQFAGGDTAMLAGQQLVIQRLTRRALTEPGSIALHPDYGCGLGALAEEVVDDTLVATIIGRINDQFPRDPAVVSVDQITVTTQGDSQILVSVWVTLVASIAPLDRPISISL